MDGSLTLDVLDDRDLVIEALSMAANRQRQLAARGAPGNHHARMERRMRTLRLQLIRRREEEHAQANPRSVV